MDSHWTCARYAIKLASSIIAREASCSLVRLDTYVSCTEDGVFDVSELLPVLVLQRLQKLAEQERVVWGFTYDGVNDSMSAKRNLASSEESVLTVVSGGDDEVHGSELDFRKISDDEVGFVDCL